MLNMLTCLEFSVSLKFKYASSYVCFKLKTTLSVGVGLGGGGWVGGLLENLQIKPNSAQFQLKLPVGAELGKKGQPE